MGLRPTKGDEAKWGGPPWSAADALVGLLLKSIKPRKSGSRGTRADQGVRPTKTISFF
jgi:hypothetical protein